MPTLSPMVLVVIGVATTAIAQVTLKKASGFEIRTLEWTTWIALSAVAYAISFLLYSQILKFYALNKIYPVLTTAQIMVITVIGIWMGEAVSGRHALGLLFGVVAIYLILG